MSLSGGFARIVALMWFNCGIISVKAAAPGCSEVD